MTKNFQAYREAKQLAEDLFCLARERILAQYGEPGKYTANQVKETGNVGSCAPALIRWASDRVRDLVLAFANSYAAAFFEFDIPSDPSSEAELRALAEQTAGGTISGLRGHLKLLSERTRTRPLNLHVDEIQRAKNSAVREGIVILRRQRIKHVKANTLEVLGEEGLISDTATLEQWHEAFKAYRSRFPELGHFGSIAERWFHLMEARFGRWEQQNAQLRAKARVQRDEVVTAWAHAKATVENAESWANYRKEFAALRLEQQGLPVTRNPPSRLSTIGEFTSGFKVLNGDSRLSCHFSEIAARAGRDLGLLSNYDPESFWHTCVFLYLRGQGNRGIFTAGKDGEDGGSVQDPLGASEELCSFLAIQAYKNISADTKIQPNGKPKSFPTRAKWLENRLLERGWSTSDPYKYGGPDRKTIERISRGESVRNGTIESLANALSKQYARVLALDIPRE